MKMDGIPTFRDSEIVALWDRMEKENTIKDVFMDGSILSGKQFLKAMKSDLNFLIVVYWKEEVSAILWVNRFQGNFAQAHFCCFSNVWGKQKIICKLGKAGSLYILNNLKLDMLLGIIPENNKPAFVAATGAGWKPVGTLPYGSYNYKTKESESAVILSFIKEEKKDENL